MKIVANFQVDKHNKVNYVKCDSKFLMTLIFGEHRKKIKDILSYYGTVSIFKVEEGRRIILETSDTDFLSTFSFTVIGNKVIYDQIKMTGIDAKDAQRNLEEHLDKMGVKDEWDSFTVARNKHI